jgi:hypothetical protein
MSPTNSKRLPRRYSLAVGLMALALWLKLLVPVGYMPSFDAETGLTLVVCSGSASSSADDPDAPTSSGAQHQPCAFMALGAALLPLALLLIVPMPRPLARTWPRFFNVQPGRGLAAPPPPCRGPPLSL